MRIQTGAISRKNYASFLGTLPETSSLNALDDFFGGFFFLADVAEVEEPKTFK